MSAGPVKVENDLAPAGLLDEAGLTLVEVIVGIGIAAGILTLVGTFVYQFFTVTRSGTERMAVSSDLQSATLWLGRDAAEAYDFIPGASPLYGTFIASQPGGEHSYRYLYDAGQNRLVREHYLDGALQETRVMSRHIASEGDVSFVDGGSLVSVSLIASRGDITDTLALELALRADTP